MKYYPDNKITHFVTRLQTPISLTGEWEVALTEISYPRSWYTVSQEGGNFLISWREDESNAIHFLDVQISQGYYNDIEDIVVEMNNALVKKLTDAGQAVVNLPKLKYSKVKRCVSVIFPNCVSRMGHLILSEQLSVILGFSKKFNLQRENGAAITGDMVCDIRGGIHSIYVYCDLLECVPVGDTLAPLLRIINVEGRIGETAHKLYNHPRYLPVQKREFDSVEIDIRDDTGAPVPFENGKLVVTLHFKRVSNPYLI